MNQNKRNQLPTFEQKIKALKKIGFNWTIEGEEHLDYELKYIQDADPDAYNKYLEILKGM